MARQIDTILSVERQVNEICENFGDYIDGLPFTEGQLQSHRRTLVLRHSLGGVRQAIDSDKFLASLRMTLVDWKMDARGARLVDIDKFIRRFRLCREMIANFEHRHITEIDSTTTKELWNLIQILQLSEGKSQMVAGTKALHHLLPQLLPPMDRGFTKPFFLYHNNQFQGREQGAAFGFMLPYFAQIARAVDLSQYVGKSPWATSESKVIDNAIVGYCKQHPLLLNKYNQAGIQHIHHTFGCRLCQSVFLS